MSDVLAYGAVVVGAVLCFWVGLLIVRELERQDRVHRRREIQRHTRQAVRRVHTRYQGAIDEAVRDAVRRQAERERQ